MSPGPAEHIYRDGVLCEVCEPPQRLATREVRDQQTGRMIPMCDLHLYAHEARERQKRGEHETA